MNLAEQKCEHGLLPEWCNECTIEQRYEWSRKVWKEVVKSDLFHFLKHDAMGRKIMFLFQQGDISLGKAAEAIVEAHELELIPRLPELPEED
jgi:hypothetical protein